MENNFLFSEENSEKVYHFVLLTTKTYGSLANKDLQSLLMKWSMNEQLQIQTYSFVEQYNEAMRTKFVRDFFDSPGGKLLNSGYCSQSSTINGKSGANLDIIPVACSAKSLDIFDPLLDPENGIVRSEGRITKCMEETVGDFLVADELQKMLIDVESENYELLPKNVRDEFIFKLFAHLVIGGQWCQYEDNIKPYINTTKAIYKDLISLYRMKDSPESRIVSKVWQIRVKDDAGVVCFPPKAHNPQNFAYFIVEPMKRELIVLTHTYGGSFPVVH